jgi:hypothetical protein
MSKPFEFMDTVIHALHDNEALLDFSKANDPSYWDKFKALLDMGVTANLTWFDIKVEEFFNPTIFLRMRCRKTRAAFKEWLTQEGTIADFEKYLEHRKD